MLNDSANHSETKKRKKPPARIGNPDEPLSVVIGPDYDKRDIRGEFINENYIDTMGIITQES